LNENTDLLLLGLLIKEPELIDDCQLIANLESPFFAHDHNKIFRDMQRLYAESGTIDRKSLMLAGKDQQISLERYTEIVNNTGFKEQLPEYISEVYDSAVKRHLQILGHNLIKCTEDELNSGESYLNIARETVDQIDKASAVQSAVTLPEAVKQVIDKAIRLSEGNTQDYIKTGILALDRIIVGFQTGTMSVIGARPSVGKSALGLTMLSNMTQAGHTAAFISVEMTAAECAERVIQVRSNVSMSQFNNGNLSAGQMQQFMTEAKALGTSNKVDMIRTTNRTIGNVRSIIRKLKNKMPALNVVFIDYIQKLGKDREEIMKVSGILTDIAADLDIHVCALAQLNREGSESPKIKHLKECGRIEEDAHYVILIDRDLHEQFNGNYEQDSNLIIAKNRGGRTGMAQVKYNAKTTRFYDGGTF